MSIGRLCDRFRSADASRSADAPSGSPPDSDRGELAAAELCALSALYTLGLGRFDGIGVRLKDGLASSFAARLSGDEGLLHWSDVAMVATVEKMVEPSGLQPSEEDGNTSDASATPDNFWYKSWMSKFLPLSLCERSAPLPPPGTASAELRLAGSAAQEEEAPSLSAKESAWNESEEVLSALESRVWEPCLPALLASAGAGAQLVVASSLELGDPASCALSALTMADGGESTT